MKDRLVPTDVEIRQIVDSRKKPGSSWSLWPRKRSFERISTGSVGPRKRPRGALSVITFPTIEDEEVGHLVDEKERYAFEQETWKGQWNKREPLDILLADEIVEPDIPTRRWYVAYDLVADRPKKGGTPNWERAYVSRDQKVTQDVLRVELEKAMRLGHDVDEIQDSIGDEDPKEYAD